MPGVIVASCDGGSSRNQCNQCRLRKLRSHRQWVAASPLWGPSQPPTSSVVLRVWTSAWCSLSLSLSLPLCLSSSRSLKLPPLLMLTIEAMLVSSLRALAWRAPSEVVEPSRSMNRRKRGDASCSGSSRGCAMERASMCVHQTTTSLHWGPARPVLGVVSVRVCVCL